MERLKNFILTSVCALFVVFGLFVSSALAASEKRVYGTATTITFELWKTDGTELKTDATSASGDVKIMKDEGAYANISADAFVNEGNGSYSIALTGTEMTAARITVLVVDQSTKTWLDKPIKIETYGHASSQHPAPKVDVDKWNGTAVATPATAGYPVVTIKDGTGTGEIDTNAGAVVSVTTATTCTTASTCSALGATAKSEVNAEVVDVINVDTWSELAACPTATASLRTMISYNYQFFRNKMTTDSSVDPEVQTLYKDNGTTPLCVNTVSDASDVFTRGEFVP